MSVKIKFEKVVNNCKECPFFASNPHEGWCRQSPAMWLSARGLGVPKECPFKK